MYICGALFLYYIYKQCINKRPWKIFFFFYKFVISIRSLRKLCLFELRDEILRIDMQKKKEVNFFFFFVILWNLILGIFILEI